MRVSGMTPQEGRGTSSLHLLVQRTTNQLRAATATHVSPHEPRSTDAGGQGAGWKHSAKPSRDREVTGKALPLCQRPEKVDPHREACGDVLQSYPDPSNRTAGHGGGQRDSGHSMYHAGLCGSSSKAQQSEQRTFDESLATTRLTLPT